MEESSLRLVFGNAPMIKILDFLIDNQEFDYCLTDIAQGADIAWSTLHEYWPRFVQLGIVLQTRRIGRAELYKLDIKNALVKRVLELDMFISKQLAREERVLEVPA